MGGSVQKDFYQGDASWKRARLEVVVMGQYCSMLRRAQGTSGVSASDRLNEFDLVDFFSA